MTRRPCLRLLAVVLPAAALLAPAAAHAEKVVTQDAVGDVTQVRMVDGTDDVTMTPAPDETATDIVRTVVAHGTTRLSITVHVRDLVPTSSHAAYIRVATPRGAYDISVENFGRSRGQVSLNRKYGVGVECRALRAKADGDANELAVSVPSSCVGSPRWVQVGVGLLGDEQRTAESVPEAIALFADDGHRGGSIREKGVDLGPRVRRG